MVGWSRRSSEDAARRRKYNEWFNAQTPEKQAEIERDELERWKRNRPIMIIMVVIGLLMLFVVWPLGVMLLKTPPKIEHRIINGHNCIVYLQTCTSTGACSLEHIRCN